MKINSFCYIILCGKNYNLYLLKGCYFNEQCIKQKTVEDLQVAGKKVLVRCDFNVKMENGVITSDKRIVASLPTIKYLIENGAKVILCSHLGRPKGEVVPEFSLAPVAARLSELLGQEVKMAKDVVGESAKALAADLKDGEVLLLENVRYEKVKQRMTLNSARNLLTLQNFMLTMLSVQLTELTLQLLVLQNTFLQLVVILFRKKLNLSVALLKIQRDLL